MSTNQSFLSPRDLLINNSFCCDGPSFRELEKALLNTENLPRNETRLCELSGLSATGLRVLQNIMFSIVEQCLNIWKASSNLRIGYSKVTDVCDQMLDVASTTKRDYDEIFDDLEKLFNDPNNEALRESVNKTIDERLYNTGILADVATATTELLTASTQDITEYQGSLKALGAALVSPDIADQLGTNNPDKEEVQADIAAVSWIEGMIADMNVEDQSAASLSNLQTLLGAVAAITSDLNYLSKSFEESAHPGPGLLLDAEKAKLLELWDHLAAEVQEFKDDYSISRQQH